MVTLRSNHTYEERRVYGCMRIGIVDADLINHSGTHYPNLACMKLSGYHKSIGDTVELITNIYSVDFGDSIWEDDTNEFDKIYVSKVFTDTTFPKFFLKEPNVEHGGTGFFFDKAPSLPDDVEHHMPDYTLYDRWVEQQLAKGVRDSKLKFFVDYSIGFTTRGCIRQCPFCVLKNKKEVVGHSKVNEFLNKDKKFICLWDDNILAYKNWKEVFEDLKAVGKPFHFKQGMDFRLLTEEKIKVLTTVKYIDRFVFAFDNIKDEDLIKRKLDMWWKHFPLRAKFRPKFFTLCGFDREGKYDDNFWIQDVADLFERIKILMKYQSYAYVMRHADLENSPWKKIYTKITGWTHPMMFYKNSFREYCGEDEIVKEFERRYPHIAEQYYDVKMEETNGN